MVTGISDHLQLAVKEVRNLSTPKGLKMPKVVKSSKVKKDEWAMRCERLTRNLNYTNLFIDLSLVGAVFGFSEQESSSTGLRCWKPMSSQIKTRGGG